MIDQGALLRAYGFTNGQFNTSSSLIDTIDMDVLGSASAIEGQEFNIDSAIEFFTAARYGGVRVTPSSRRVVDRELPRGREGDLKLGAAWLEKLQRRDTSQESCNRALAFISGRSGVGVSEIRDYYRREVTRRLVAIARVEFPAGTSLPETIQPLIDYVASFDGRGNLRVNDEALYRCLYESVRRQFGTGTGAYLGYLKTIESVNDSLRNTVDSDIDEQRRIRNR